MRIFRIVMLGFVAAVALGLRVPSATAAQADVVQRLQDGAEIAALIVSYGTALDTRDADAYAGIFAEDAQRAVAGNVRKGRQQIREIKSRSAPSASTTTCC